jgi:hypothetical protein
MLASALFGLLVVCQAHAQFGVGYYPSGYGGYGWGGWGGGIPVGGGATAPGDIARGLGYYNIGAGIYNQQTAVANAINTDTVMRWNQYLYLSQQEANRYERALLARRQARTAEARAAIEKRIRENPSADDIANGNALNSILDEVTDPKIHGSALRLATAKLPAKLVRAIPFANASEAVTISLDKLTAEGGWPAALRDPKFDEERKGYSEAVDKALEEDREGEISGPTLALIREHLDRLRAKLEAKPPADKAQLAEAQAYLKTLYGLTKMLARPDVEKIIAELESIVETSLGSLLGFMHTFNLRFGKATTAAERNANEQLYPLLASFRERVNKEVGSDKTDEAKAKASDKASPTDFFRGMQLDHLSGKRNDK